jgi:signal transduction histidine kinase
MSLLSPKAFLSQMRRLGRTHAFRLAILYFAVFAVSVLGVLVFVYWMSADFVERQTQATLDAEIAGLAEQYDQRGLSGLVQIVAARSAGDPGDGMLYLVTSPDGHPLAGNITGWPEGKPVAPGPIDFKVSVKVRNHTEMHPVQGALLVIPQGYRLLVARDISDAALFRDRVKETLLWAGLLALCAGVVGGAVMGLNLLRRVEEVNRTAERVMGGNLSDRVPLKGTGDEFDQLAANLNNMLDQIERLMAGMREVSDNIAHDLRTPLSRLRARLELSLLGTPDAAAQNEAVRAAIDEADRLLVTFNALLNIAEAESGSRRSAAEPLDLAQTARAAAELYEPVAEEKGCALQLDVEPGIMIRGDRHLLSQALANLLDNALKYGGGEIKLSAHQHDGRAALEVSDSGPGIPEDEREAVFDRFVRLEPSRSTPGNGLGLSLVRAVARLHNGTVQLGETQPGTGYPGLTVRLEFAAL